MGEKKPFPEMIDKTNLVASMAQTATKGAKSTVHPDLETNGGEAGVRMWAPTVKMSADVSLVKDCEPDPATVDVGWVQVIESVRRVAIYEADGKVVFRKVGGITDSVRDTEKSDGNRWFTDTPGKVAKVELSAAKPKGHVESTDSPSQWYPRSAGGGTLTRMEGEDKFRTTLMAAPGGGEPAHALKTFAWSVPWESKIEITKEARKGKGVFAGGGGETARSPNAKPLDINAKAPLDGTDAKDKANNGLDKMAQFEAYDTVEAAAKRLDAAPISFFSELAVAKGLDHDTYWNMVGALWKSNKCFKLAVKPDKDDDKDQQFDVEFAGTAKFPLSGSARTSFAALGHMVYDPANLPGAFTVSINGQTIHTMKSPTDGLPAKAVTITKKKPGFLDEKTFTATVTISFGDP